MAYVYALNADLMILLSLGFLILSVAGVFVTSALKEIGTFQKMEHMRMKRVHSQMMKRMLNV